MDEVHSRGKYDQSAYQSTGNYGASVSGNNVLERYGRSPAQARQLSANESRSSTGSHGQALRIFPYAQSQQQYAPPLQDNSLEYQAGYPQDVQRQQQYNSYSSGMMSSMMASVQPAQQASGFDPVQQYQPRHSAALEVLSSQFGVPQYYNTAEPSSAAPQIPQAYASAHYQQQAPFQQSMPANRPSDSNPYAAGVGEYSQLNMSSGPEPAEASQDAPASDEPYKAYLESLRQTYQDTIEGRLVEAGRRLLELSDWLIGHANDLGQPILIWLALRKRPNCADFLQA